MSIKFDAGPLLSGFDKFSTKADVAIKMYCETSALTLEGYARENRRWTDRTGHARQRLNCKCLSLANGYRLELGHGVDYGLWLELANEKRFAIIMETINTVGNGEIMPGFERLIDRLGGKI